MTERRMIHFHPCLPLMEYSADVDEGTIQTLAATISKKVTFPRIAGRLDDVRFEYEFGADRLVRRLRMQFTFTDPFVCNAAKSRIGPDLESRGFTEMRKQARAPSLNGGPSPWRRTEWTAPHHERVVREVRRSDKLEVLMLERLFDQPAAALAKPSLQDLFVF